MKTTQKTCSIRKMNRTLNITKHKIKVFKEKKKKKKTTKNGKTKQNKSKEATRSNLVYISDQTTIRVDENRNSLYRLTTNSHQL